jgi:DHA1 family inner membrane transport protein
LSGRRREAEQRDHEVNTTVAHRNGQAALLVLGQSVQSLAVTGLALFLPLIRKDIHLTFSQAGVVIVAATLTFALFQVPVGFMTDRLGAKPLFLAGIIGTSVLAFSLSSVHSYQLLIVNQAASGVFRALLFAPGIVLISSLFPSHRQATAIGLLVAAGFSSNIFLNLLGPLLVKPLGWRVLFELFASMGFLFFLLYLWRGAAPARDRPRRRLRLAEAGGILNHPIMWLCGIVQFVRLAVGSSLMFWLPSFLVNERGYSLRTAGLILAFAAVMTAPSNFLGGYLSDRLQRPTAVIVGCLVVTAAMLSALPNVRGLGPLVAVVCINALVIQLYFGPLFSIPIRQFGAESAGLTSGFSNFCANVGGLTATFALGAIRDATGSFDAGFYVLSAVCIMGIACALALGRLTSSGRDQEQPLMTATPANA